MFWAPEREVGNNIQKFFQGLKRIAKGRPVLYIDVDRVIGQK